MDLLGFRHRLGCSGHREVLGCNIPPYGDQAFSVGPAGVLLPMDGMLVHHRLASQLTHSTPVSPFWNFGSDVC
jgi:hypothetical protein